MAVPCPKHVDRGGKDQGGLEKDMEEFGVR